MTAPLERWLNPIRATPDMTRDTLMPYAKRVFDLAAREFRRMPTEDSGRCLVLAMSAMRTTSSLTHPAPPGSRHIYVASSAAINETAAA